MEERQKRRRVGLACCSSPAAPPRHGARRAGVAARPAPGAVPGTTSEEDEGDGYHTAEEDFGPDGPRARSGCAQPPSPPPHPRPPTHPYPPPATPWGLLSPGPAVGRAKGRPGRGRGARPDRGGAVWLAAARRCCPCRRRVPRTAASASTAQCRRRSLRSARTSRSVRPTETFPADWPPPLSTARSVARRLNAGSTEQEWPQVAQMQQRMRDDGVYGT